MFEDLFKRCSHEYKQVGFIPAIVNHDGQEYDVPCYFLECKNCGKRKVLRESDYNYSDSFLDTLELWIKGQYKINFKEYQNMKPSRIYEEQGNDIRYEAALLKILDELKQLEVPMYDSNGRLVINNIKGIIKNALTVEVDNEETK